MSFFLLGKISFAGPDDTSRDFLLKHLALLFRTCALHDEAGTSFAESRSVVGRDLCKTGLHRRVFPEWDCSSFVLSEVVGG